MKFETSSAGYDISFDAPNTVEEYDSKSEPGQCLRDAIAETVNRATILDWQKEFAKVLAERTGIPREIDQKATAAVKAKAKNPDNTRDILERFSSYNKKVNDQYTNGDNAKRTELETWAQEVADRVIVDPARQRVGTIAKGDLVKAEDVLSGTPESIEEKVQKYLNVVGDFDLTRDDSGLPEKQSLARLIGKYVAELL